MIGNNNVGKRGATATATATASGQPGVVAHMHVGNWRELLEAHPR